MATTVQFVDSIASSPTVRLDLNDTTRASGWMVSADGLDLSPPPMRRSVVSTMLRDGEPISAGAYGNRTLTIPLTYVGTNTANAAALALQALAAQLNRPTNILKVQLGTVPAFFRTYRAPDFALSVQRLFLQNNTVVLEIPAEPFALGLMETPSGSPYTVNFNPAAGSNGAFFDVTSVKGDVEAPLRITAPIADLPTVVALRRRGTPSAVPFVLQAEAMSLGSGTTLPGNDALMSGAGSNYARVAAASLLGAPLTNRLEMDPYPASPSVDARGTYRVFGRFRKSVGTDQAQVTLFYGNLTSMGTVTLTANSTAAQVVDLGLVSFPLQAAPVYDATGAEMSVQGFRFILGAGYTAGTGTLDIDYLLFVPADDRLAILSRSGAPIAPPVRVRLDAEQEAVYGLTAAEVVDGGYTYSLAGSLPYVSPGVTNRVYFLESLTSAISATATVTAVYWPRYLLVPGS